MAKRPMISIVDDDESVREATMSLMRAAGFSPEAFQSGNDFLKSERCGHTDCLIADVQMPGMSGLEMHGRIVQSGNDIPTVLITAYPDDKTRARALKAGIVCYLTKPFNDQELLDCIQLALAQGATRSKSS
jgi:FixJ family two-component response regulator